MAVAALAARGPWVARAEVGDVAGGAPRIPQTAAAAKSGRRRGQTRTCSLKKANRGNVGLNVGSDFEFFLKVRPEIPRMTLGMTQESIRQSGQI